MKKHCSVIKQLLSICKAIILACCLLLIHVLHAQPDKKTKSTSEQNFSIFLNDVTQKLKEALWLSIYDAAAWISSDSILAMLENVDDDTTDYSNLLTRHWFCFERDGQWHAVYGKFLQDTYQVVYHFVVDTSSNAILTDDEIEQAFLIKHARAIETAYAQIEDFIEKNPIRYNHYVRENHDGTFNVWIFPAIQPSGVAVYGAQFIFVIDPSGLQILSDESSTRDALRGWQINKQKNIIMDYSERNDIPMEAVFFSVNNYNFFDDIQIRTSTYHYSLKYIRNHWLLYQFHRPDNTGKKKKQNPSVNVFLLNL